MRKVPELLSPAGNLEKLKVAINYGADAVYLAGQEYGLRTAADNFTPQELVQAVTYAHTRKAKVYVVLNSYLHDQDFENLGEFLLFLEDLKVDALIISDLGVLDFCRNRVKIPLHLSTQASCLNARAGKLWKKFGVSRLILGREVTLKEAKLIKEQTGLEIEMFIHGSMCMAYSGNCTISNYTAGRDSNRGGCAHSCRFEYTLSDPSQQNLEDEVSRFFMSSKDLQGIELLQGYLDAGIDSIKVEGRMKSHLYVGTVSKIYKEALKHYKKNEKPSSEQLNLWQEELEKFSHRSYTSEPLTKIPGEASIFSERENIHPEYKVVGHILEVCQGKHLLVEVRNAFHPGDELEVLTYEGQALKLSPESITDISGNLVTRTKPSALVKLPFIPGVKNWNLLRMRSTL